MAEVLCESFAGGDAAEAAAAGSPHGLVAPPSTPGPQPSTGLEAAEDLRTFVAEAQFRADSLDELVLVGGVATLSMALFAHPIGSPSAQRCC